MVLTKLQQVILQRYKGYRQQPPTFARLLQQSWQVEVILVIASMIGVCVAYSLQLYAAVYFIIGLLIGALARDVGTFRRVLQIWPALSQVLDWQRIDQILNQEKID